MADQEAQAHWEGVLGGVDRPAAREMMAQLDLRHLLGLVGGTTYGRGRKAPLLPLFTSVKREHPTKVLLVRVRPSLDNPWLVDNVCLDPADNGGMTERHCGAALADQHDIVLLVFIA